MLGRLRSARFSAGLLVLSAFTAWLGGAYFHHHSGSAPCETCNVLLASPASLPGAPPALRMTSVIQRLVPVVLLAGGEGHTALPLGRAPPLA